jgi:hypothetical protein
MKKKKEEDCYIILYKDGKEKRFFKKWSTRHYRDWTSNVGEAKIYKRLNAAKKTIEKIKNIEQQRSFTNEKLLKSINTLRADKILKQGFTFLINDDYSKEVKIIRCQRLKNTRGETPLYSTELEAKKGLVKELIKRKEKLTKTIEQKALGLNQSIKDLAEYLKQKPDLNFTDKDVERLVEFTEAEQNLRNDIDDEKNTLQFYIEKVNEIMPQSARFILGV